MRFSHFHAKASCSCCRSWVCMLGANVDLGICWTIPGVSLQVKQSAACKSSPSCSSSSCHKPNWHATRFHCGRYFGSNLMCQFWCTLQVTSASLPNMLSMHLLYLRPTIIYASSASHASLSHWHTLQVPLAVSVLLDPKMIQDRLYSTSSTSNTMLAIASGYFLHDLVVCTIQLKTWGPAYLFHALFCSMLYCYGFFSQVLHYYGKHDAASLV